MFGCDGCIHTYSPKKKDWVGYGGLFSSPCENCRHRYTPEEIKKRDIKVRYYSVSEDDKNWEFDGWSLKEVEDKIKEKEKLLNKNRPEKLLIMSDNGYVSK